MPTDLPPYLPPYLPHDLLWVAPGAIQLDGVMPAWADAAWLRSAPVVVRREACADGLVPVGLRGLARNQRVKAYVPAGAVTRTMTPEALAAKASAAAGAGQGGMAPHGAAAGIAGVFELPALAILAALAPILNAAGLAWGPAGGVGFFLASGLPVLRPDSDLDLLVRAPMPLNRAQIAALDAILAGAACRIDIQVDSGHGGFAFAEWRRGGRVMLKTGAGPQLVADPWMALEAA